MRRIFALAVLTSLCASVSVAQTQPASTESIPELRDALQSKRDVWGELAMREPDGPSYAFFEKLLPPLRYVDTSFRHYPIMLDSPTGPPGRAKSRLVSNGSAIDA